MHRFICYCQHIELWTGDDQFEHRLDQTWGDKITMNLIAGKRETAGAILRTFFNTAFTYYMLCN